MTKPTNDKLERLGLRVPPEAVASAVHRLAGGATANEIYEHPSIPALRLGKGTVVKIKRLFQDGKLDFLLEEEHSPAPKQLAELVGDISGLDWSIRDLELRGVPAEEAPKLLAAHDSLARDPLVTGPLEEDTEFLLLCFQVKLYDDYPEIPPHIVNALTIEAYEDFVLFEDVVTEGPSLLDLVLKYQSWRSREHYRLFVKAWGADQRPTAAVPRQRRRLLRKITAWMRREEGGHS